VPRTRSMLWRGWLLGCVMEAAGSMAFQDSHGGLEGYCAHLRNGHWWNTPWWLWAGVWLLGFVIFIVVFLREK
jgi:hypothetical protein